MHIKRESLEYIISDFIIPEQYSEDYLTYDGIILWINDPRKSTQIMTQLSNIYYSGSISVIHENFVIKQIYIIDGDYMHINDIVNTREVYLIHNGQCSTLLIIQKDTRTYDLDYIYDHIKIMYNVDKDADAGEDIVKYVKYHECHSESDFVYQSGIDQLTSDQESILKRYQIKIETIINDMHTRIKKLILK